MSYNRYNRFLINGKYEMVPSVPIYSKSTDYMEIYKAGVTRLDLLSNKYYGDPNYDWLIMMANPEYGSMEFNIPDGAILRIPFPLNLTIDAYNRAIDSYNNLYK